MTLRDRLGGPGGPGREDGRPDRPPSSLRDNPVVVLEPGVGLEKALRELRKRLDAGGSVREQKRREHARSPSQARREKSARARARARKAERRQAAAEAGRG
jgi:ribosomal protein S21